MAKQVETLRRFRDTYLLPHGAGQQLIEFYYRIGKPVATFIESHPWLKSPVRLLLYPVVGIAWLMVSTGIIFKVLIGLLVLSCSAIAFRRYRGKSFLGS
jgi:hypothetical protein